MHCANFVNLQPANFLAQSLFKLGTSKNIQFWCHAQHSFDFGASIIFNSESDIFQVLIFQPTWYHDICKGRFEVIQPKSMYDRVKLGYFEIEYNRSQTTSFSCL